MKADKHRLVGARRRIEGSVAAGERHGLHAGRRIRSCISDMLEIIMLIVFKASFVRMKKLEHEASYQN